MVYQHRGPASSLAHHPGPRSPEGSASVLYTLKLLQILSQVGPSGALAKGGKWTAVYTPCPRALSVLSSHKWDSLLPYTIWVTASASPTYAYLLPALCGWQVPLQPAHHCFCYLAANEDDLAEGSFTCTAMRMERQEAPDWGSPSQPVALLLCLSLHQVLSVCLLCWIMAATLVCRHQNG